MNDELQGDNVRSSCSIQRSSLATTFRREQVHSSVFLATGAVVIGDVTIGEHSSVWFNAVVRGDTEAIRIGAMSNVQDGAVLHADPGFPCTLGDSVTVGHGAIVHGAQVEDGVTIGMGAIVLNGARIGRGSLIGAGALVPEHAEIPPGSLVLGVPGKVRRALSSEEVEKHQAAAARYVEAAREYMQPTITP